MLVGVISVLVGSATRGHALPVRVGLFEGEELPGDRNFKPLPPFNSSLSPIILIPFVCWPDRFADACAVAGHRWIRDGGEEVSDARVDPLLRGIILRIRHATPDA
eukprot:125695-Rhodomonas_salina.1